MAMSSVAKKDKPTMSVTALINWARPAPPGPMQPPPAALAPSVNMLQALPSPSNMPTVDCSLDMQCNYTFVVSSSETHFFTQ